MNPSPDTSAPHAPAPATPATAAPVANDPVRTWSMLAHLSGIVGFLGPLLVLLLKKDLGAPVEREAKEALNFQIFVAALCLAAFILGTVLTFVVVGVFILMIAPLIPLVGVVFAIVGAVKANATGTYRYPFTVRVLR